VLLLGRSFGRGGALDRDVRDGLVLALVVVPAGQLDLLAGLQGLEGLGGGGLDLDGLVGAKG
jgi:hypothetical protein